MSHLDYDAFLRAKVTIAQPKGFDVDPADVNPLLKPHQVAAIIWAIRPSSAAHLIPGPARRGQGSS